jgi:hypothetical protein
MRITSSYFSLTALSREERRQDRCMEEKFFIIFLPAKVFRFLLGGAEKMFHAETTFECFLKTSRGGIIS